MIILQSVVEGVVVVEVPDLVEVEVDVWVEVVVKNWLINDPICFGTYHVLDSDHQS